MNDDVTPPPQFKDEDLVYVDPEARTVVGLVEWSKTGNPKPLPVPQIKAEEEPVGEKGGKRRRPPSQKFYPWGTYKSMKKIYRLEGKVGKTVPTATLDDVIDKALQQPYWD